MSASIFHEDRIGISNSGRVIVTGMVMFSPGSNKLVNSTGASIDQYGVASNIPTLISY